MDYSYIFINNTSTTYYYIIILSIAYAVPPEQSVLPSMPPSSKYIQWNELRKIGCMCAHSLLFVFRNSHIDKHTRTYQYTYTYVPVVARCARQFCHSYEITHSVYTQLRLAIYVYMHIKIPIPYIYEYNVDTRAYIWNDLSNTTTNEIGAHCFFTSQNLSFLFYIVFTHFDFTYI